MKVIITGATGIVGSALVRECIANPRITRALVLTRKPLNPELAGSSKITVIQHDDFSSYPPELLEQLAGAEGCLWAIGGRVPQFPDLATAKKVQVDYTLAAAQAFQGLSGDKPFRFVFCSGKFSEWDQDKRLVFMQDSRRLKGEVEKKLFDLAEASRGRLDLWIVRPSGILAAGTGAVLKLTARLYGGIADDQVARGMTKIVLDGHEPRIVENSALLAPRD